MKGPLNLLLLALLGIKLLLNKYDKVNSLIFVFEGCQKFAKAARKLFEKENDPNENKSK